MKPEAITNFVFTPHAEFEMDRRGIDKKCVEKVLKNPGQMRDIRPGRVLIQSRFKEDESGKEYLIRVFVDRDRTPPEVVTVYKTTKISKYWT